MTAATRDLQALFVQLGLSSSNVEIESFVAEHRIENGTPVCEVPFWNRGQRQFLQEALDSDAERSIALQLC